MDDTPAALDMHVFNPTRKPLDEQMLAQSREMRSRLDEWKKKREEERRTRSRLGPIRANAASRRELRAKVTRVQKRVVMAKENNDPALKSVCDQLSKEREAHKALRSEKKGDPSRVDAELREMQHLWEQAKQGGIAGSMLMAHTVRTPRFWSEWFALLVRVRDWKTLAQCASDAQANLGDQWQPSMLQSVFESIAAGAAQQTQQAQQAPTPAPAPAAPAAQAKPAVVPEANKHRTPPAILVSCPPKPVEPVRTPGHDDRDEAPKEAAPSPREPSKARSVVPAVAQGLKGSAEKEQQSKGDESEEEDEEEEEEGEEEDDGRMSDEEPKRVAPVEADKPQDEPQAAANGNHGDGGKRVMFNFGTPAPSKAFNFYKDAQYGARAPNSDQPSPAAKSGSSLLSPSSVPMRVHAPWPRVPAHQALPMRVRTPGKGTPIRAPSEAPPKPSPVPVVEGGSVIVFSPVRATAQQMRTLGADTVLSPIRRSRRTGVVGSSPAVGDNGDQAPKFSNLLEGTNYAYAPNNAIPRSDLPVPPAFVPAAGAAAKSRGTPVAQPNKTKRPVQEEERELSGEEEEDSGSHEDELADEIAQPDFSDCHETPTKQTRKKRGLDLLQQEAQKMLTPKRSKRGGDDDCDASLLAFDDEPRTPGTPRRSSRLSRVHAKGEGK